MDQTLSQKYSGRSEEELDGAMRDKQAREKTMKYTKPTRLDGRWQIEEFCCSSDGSMDSIEVYKQRDNGTRGTICQIENPDMGEAKDPGYSAGDLALITAAPIMYEFLVEIEKTPTWGEASIRHRAKEIRQLIEEEADNLIAEAEDAYADAGVE